MTGYQRIVIQVDDISRYRALGPSGMERAYHDYIDRLMAQCEADLNFTLLYGIPSPPDWDKIYEPTDR